MKTSLFPAMFGALIGSLGVFTGDDFLILMSVILSCTAFICITIERAAPS